MNFEWHPLAQAEFEDALEYYIFNASPSISRELATEVNRMLTEIQTYPEIGVATLKRARRIHLHGFPLNLVYRLNAENIFIVALAHQRRRPGYWAGRY